VNTDGIVTIAPRNDPKRLKEEILPAYRRGRAEANKTGPGRVAMELIFTFDKPEKIVRSS
jgi:hypothetical protein